MQIDKLNNDVKAVIPYTSFGNAKSLLICLYKAKGKSKNRRDIANFCGLSKSTIGSSIRIAIELGLVHKSGNYYYLTSRGRELTEYIMNDDVVNIKKTGEESIIKLKKSPALLFTLKTYNDNPDISNFQLGELIATEFHKQQLDESTYVNYGTSGLSILEGLHLIQRHKVKTNIKSEKKSRKTRQPNKTASRLLPRISIDYITRYVSKFGGAETLSFISPLHNENEKNTIKEHLGVIMNLGIIEHTGNSSYKLTQEGLLFRNSIGTDNEKKVFQKILLDYEPIIFILNKIKTDKTKDIDYNLLGDLIGQYNEVDYSVNSKKKYGSKLLDWLSRGGLVIENHEHGKYHLNPIAVSRHKIIDDTKLISVPVGKPKTSDDGISLNNLYRYYVWILYSDYDEKWYSNEINKLMITKILDKLISDSHGINNTIFKDVKKWLEEGYKTRNIEYIENSFKLIINIDKNSNSGSV